jgi:GNAT superfamily N-acetyltransferase
VEVRTLHPDDVPAAARVAFEAMPVPENFSHDDRIPWLERRTAYLAERDPAGAWVAEEDGEVIGMTNAIVRDGIWGLSMMAVSPARHARGTGTALLRAALTHAEGTRGQLIMSSQDPKAMRLYARAGFDLLPGISLAGVLDRSAIPAVLTARETDDLEAAAALGRLVRGGAYDARDIALLLTLPDAGILMVEGRGFVLHQGGRPNLLVADSEDVATDLLWSAFACTAPGGSVDVDPVTAGQDWAVRVGLDAGLAITPSGPMFTRGALGPLRPWLASGTLL